MNTCSLRNLHATRSHAPRAAWAILATGALAALSTGCLSDRLGSDAHRGPTFYPPAPQTPRVVALGTLRGEPELNETQIRLAEFLFGTAPTTALAIATPTGLAAGENFVLVCDSSLDAVLCWQPTQLGLREVRVRPVSERPYAVDVLPGGGMLLCDARGARRLSARGETLCEYVAPPESSPGAAITAFRTAGILAVGDAAWVANLAAHRLDVFDAGTGEYRRSIGSHGRDEGQFRMPRGLARTPDGLVCVVDMLNNRVQVFDSEGTVVRVIGQPGDTTGSFGRPKDVTVGLDGTVFVTDDFSQRVHAFAPGGQPLLAFGEPGTGLGELFVPAGIATCGMPPPAQQPLPADYHALYYVLVAEQLDRPGVRVYAWLGNEEVAPPVEPLDASTSSWRPRFPESVAINPHWDPDRCTTCHQEEEGRIVPVPREQSDALCLSCHDGVQAPADPHPIGRPANTELVTTPPEWPTINGNIGCITCHDIMRHCRQETRRPPVNSELIRGWDPQRPLDHCTICHRGDLGGRFSPHQQRDASGKVREDACLFCHTQRPEVPEDGLRRFQPHLRTESSDVCLNCHVKHWDLSPLGHVDRPVTPRIRQWMLMREINHQSQAPPEELSRLAAESAREPARLPLAGNRVACYTCHNPHYAGLFPEGSELGALAENPSDRASALRTDWVKLCSECHHH